MIWYQRILDHLLQGPHFIGFTIWLIMTLLQEVLFFVNRENVIKGLKGKNGMWEAPELFVWVLLRLIPQFVMWVTLLGFRPPEWIYWLVGAGLLFSLTGRWGLEYILTRIPGSFSKTEVKIEETKVNE